MSLPKTKPLNGEKTHPLSAIALDWLCKIAKAPVPQIAINPGVRDRLLRESLVEIVQLPNPFKTKPGTYPHFCITIAGRKVIAALNESA